MNLERRRIFCDIDGVLADTQFKALEEAQVRYGLKDFNFSDWNTFEALTLAVKKQHSGLDLRQIDDELFGNELMSRVKPLLGAREGIAEIAEENEIWAVTSRPSSPQLLTREWIRDYFGDYIKNVCIRNINHDGINGTDFKIRVLAREGASIHIDDDEKVVNFLMQMGGIRPILMEQPWNRVAELSHMSTNWQSLPRLLKDQAAI